MRESNGIRALALSSVIAFLLSGAAQAQRSSYSRQVSLPRGTVLRAELNDRLSSVDSRPGDRFTGTIRDDGSGLPSGTEVVGQVSEVRRAGDKQPGVVDVDFRSLRLPNGSVYPIDGRLTSLDADNVQRTSSGRLEARHRSSTSERNKFLGYGAGAGAIISALTGGSLLKGALLGGAAGFVLNQLNKDKNSNGRYSEVNLKPGTAFGIELTRTTNVRLADNRDDAYDGYTSRTSRYDRASGNGAAYPADGRYDRSNGRYPYNERTAGSIERYSGDPRVIVDGHELRFNDGRPFMSAGRLMVPLAPVMAAAGHRYNFDPNYSEITVFGDRGDARLRLGEDYAYVNGDRVHVDTPAQRVDGVLYVPVQFLEQSTDLRSDWDANSRTLHLTSRDRDNSTRDDRYDSRGR
jgi:hypothetical protein